MASSDLSKRMILKYRNDLRKLSKEEILFLVKKLYESSPVPRESSLFAKLLEKRIIRPDGAFFCEDELLDAAELLLAE